MVAYACVISEANFTVIASEKPDFDREETIKWLDQHEQGYFLRDEESALDCKYFETTVFNQLYRFEYGDTNTLFRRVVKL